MAMVTRAGEIILGINVKNPALNVPINEQPYFGFAKKSAEQIAADNAFLSGFAETGRPTRDVASEIVSNAGNALFAGQFAPAARRLNQAYLLDPSSSAIAHFFALIVAARFGNSEYALELFAAAAKLRDPLPSLPADHGFTLLAVRRPAEAIPLLERAVRQMPNQAKPKAHLAAALLMAGKVDRACEAISKVGGDGMEAVVQQLNLLKTQARCP